MTANIHNLFIDNQYSISKSGLTNASLFENDNAAAVLYKYDATNNTSQICNDYNESQKFCYISNNTINMFVIFIVILFVCFGFTSF